MPSGSCEESSVSFQLSDKYSNENSNCSQSNLPEGKKHVESPACVAVGINKLASKQQAD